MKLFEDFNKVSDQEWLDKIQADLRGKSMDEIAKSRPYEGIDLNVFYSASSAPEAVEVIMNPDWNIGEEESYLEETMADPIHHLMTTGNWLSGEEEKEFDAYLSVFKSEYPGKSIAVNAQAFQSAGGSAITELAFATAHANEYFHVLKSHKKLEKDALKHLTLRMGIGSDYFMEIAKFRSIRILIRQLARAYELNDAIPFILYAENGLLAFSAKDPNTNILRNTTAGMSAILGGCDHLILPAHDRLGKNFHEFGDRIARNIQLMMKHESHLDKVKDPGKGSYFIEWLTREISSKAWTLFQEIENDGGLLEGFKKGKIQKRIEADAEKRKSAFLHQEDVYVGINKYENPDKGLERKLEKVVEDGEYKAIKPLILEDLS